MNADLCCRFRQLMRQAAIGIFAVALGGGAVANTPAQYDWEEAARRIKASEKVAPLGSDMLGDELRLSNGELSFSAVDVSIPGNNSLPVHFKRSYSVFNRKGYGNLGVMGDWIVDIPNVSAVLLGDWVYGTNQSTARCTQAPNPIGPYDFNAADFWQGINISLHQGGGELLLLDSNAQKPTSGSYPWGTSDHIRVSCITSAGAVKNGTGEAFLAIAPDGTKYWLDWMAQSNESPLKTRPLPYTAFVVSPNRKRSALYVTRVEDVYGNYVTYTYSNQWNQPIKPTRIQSSDQARTIDISYDANGMLQTVKANGRTWTYAYGTTSKSRRTLNRVTLPDNTFWSINFTSFTDAELIFRDDATPAEPARSCLLDEMPQNINGPYPNGTITHPAGVSGSFDVRPILHGRSNVPVNCRGVTTTVGLPPGTGNDPNNDVNVYPVAAYVYSITQKTLSGAGMSPLNWSYSYNPGVSRAALTHTGATFNYPVCTKANPLEGTSKNPLSRASILQQSALLTTPG